MDYFDREFSYSVTDNDVSMLRNEVLRLDDEVTQGLKDVSPSEAETGMSVIYNEIAKKYNLDVSYKDFRSFIHDIATEGKLESSVNEALNAKVFKGLARRTQMKLIISMSYLIDRAADLMELQSKADNIVTPELIVTIDKMVVWYQQLQNMIDNQKLQDPDKAIDRAITQDKRDNPEKYSDSEQFNSESNVNKDIGLIKNLVNSLRNESNNE